MAALDRDVLCMRNAPPKRAQANSSSEGDNRRRSAAGLVGLRAVSVVGIALGATQLGACVRYDSMRVFYGRDSVVLRPDGGNASQPDEALATVPDHDD